jgi:hypothetical protein
VEEGLANDSETQVLVRFETPLPGSSLRATAEVTISGLELDDLAVGRLHHQGPCGGDAAGRSPVDRGK